MDRLLRSPRHAERMATWWFDLVRYADTVGYHGDQVHPIAPYRDKKCWTRSYVLDIEQLSNTTAAGARGSGSGTGMRQRMLTSMVCEDQQYWFAGFRILQ